MPRQTLTKTIAPGNWAAAGVAVTMTAANITDKEQFVAQGKDLLIVQNTDSGAHTFTINSTADPYGRTKDITAESIAAGAIRVFGPMELTGWVQSDGRIYLEANSALVKFGVITLPG
jgi:hypothetical protein